MIPWLPPPPSEAERIRRALERHVAERNRADEERQEKAAERVLERLWDQKG